MERKLFAVLTVLALVLTSAAVGVAAGEKGKDKALPSNENDPTYRLFQWLDTTHGGKLTDFYVVADVCKNPENPQEEFQRVLRVEYDKSRVFGRLVLYVRDVSKMNPAQMIVYTPKQIYEFAESDMEKFTKTDPGPLGGPGDLYLRATSTRALGTVQITEAVRQDYERLLSQHVVPALMKK